MNEEDYKKHMVKIYLSLSFSILWFLYIFIVARLFPGTFQAQSVMGKTSILMIIVLGIAYVFFLIKFLSSKKSIACMNYYNKRKNKL